MGIKQVFHNFAADFELTVADDNWQRLEKYFSDNASYQNIGQEKYTGPKAILNYLKEDVTKTDRRFDSRSLIALTEPTVNGNHLFRQWRTTYTLAGVPDLVVEGEARYIFNGEFIQQIEEEVTPKSLQILEQWMQEYGDRLT